MSKRKRSRKPDYLFAVYARRVWFHMSCRPDGISCGDKKCKKCRWLLMGWRIVMKNGDSYFCSAGKKERQASLRPARRQDDAPNTFMGNKVVPYRKASSPSWSAEINGVKESIGSDLALIERFKSCPKLINALFHYRHRATKKTTQL